MAKLLISWLQQVREITEAGGEALATQVDVRDFENIQTMVEQTIKKFGRLDVLVYNSGAIWWAARNSAAAIPLALQTRHRVRQKRYHAAAEQKWSCETVATFQHLCKHRRALC